MVWLTSASSLDASWSDSHSSKLGDLGQLVLWHLRVDYNFFKLGILKPPRTVVNIFEMMRKNSQVVVSMIQRHTVTSYHKGESFSWGF